MLNRPIIHDLDLGAGQIPVRALMEMLQVPPCEKQGSIYANSRP